MLKKLKEFNKAFDIRNKTDYTFKKWIFLTALIISLLFVSLIFLQSKTLKYQYYTKCPDLDPDNYMYGKPCKNSLYMACSEDICNKEFLEYGKEYGNKPPFLMKYGNYTIVTLLVLAFVFNHLIYNKGKKFKLEMEEEEH